MLTAFYRIDTAQGILYCQGEWTINTLMALKKTLMTLTVPHQLKKISGQELKQLDSAGALVLEQLLVSLPKEQMLTLTAFKPEHKSLLQLITSSQYKNQHVPMMARPNLLARFGRLSINKLQEFVEFLSFIGELTVTLFKLIFRRPIRIPWRACIGVIESTGVYALPIIALLSFLIGIVLTYQMGLQLRNYGANIYIVDLLGLSILREFSPLMTAIIVAGRTGSALTAQLGTMKIREEIDALRTMGIAPSELLILPKIFALLLVLPLLTIWSSIFGIMGGMLISNTMLNVPYGDFLHRFYEAIQVRSYWVGMLKAPVFGWLIASIACFQGMKVTGSAVSIGQKTTVSVVQSIFFIIVVDAIFSVVFSWLGI